MIRNYLEREFEARAGKLADTLMSSRSEKHGEVKCSLGV
jgi:hypothetical protein